MLLHFSPQAGLQPRPGYHLRRLLGGGAFGQVWEADTEDGPPVALKFMPCGNGGAATRELRSIQIVRQLSHPRLIRIHQVWCQPGYLVVAMELADGSLLDLLELCKEEHGTPIPARQACDFLTQAAE